MCVSICLNVHMSSGAHVPEASDLPGAVVSGCFELPNLGAEI